MLLKIILIASLFIVGCNDKQDSPNAIRCVHVWEVPENPSKEDLERTLLASYWTCLNKKTGEKENVPILDMRLCLTDKSKLCKWTGTDVLEYDKAEKWVNDKTHQGR